MKPDTIQLMDLLRTFAIICIVCAHFDSYTNILFFYKYDLYFAYIGLIIFFFISGFLIHYTNKTKSKKDLKNSIKKRAKRIYPLYWLSILITIILDTLHLSIRPSFLNIHDIIVSLFGLQCIFIMYKGPPAMWFIGAIIVFYVAYYIISYLTKNPFIFLLYSIILYIVLILLKICLNLVHINLLIYYFIYIFGILISFICCSKNRSPERINSIILTSIFFLILPFILYQKVSSTLLENGATESLFSVFVHGGLINMILNDEFQLLMMSNMYILFVAIVFGIAIYYVSLNIPNKMISKRLFSKTAYASYAVYLFHIQILSLIKYFYTSALGEWVNTDWLLLISSIPILFVISWHIQRKHDNLL